MNLKTKRTLPVILLLAAILAVMAFGMGNQPIQSYTINLAATPAAQVTTLR